MGRTLGQGTKTPSEVLFNQPDKDEFARQMHEALVELEASLPDQDELIGLMETNIQFHGGPYGVIERLFKKAGIVGARNANLRMYAFSLRITDDRPGKLIELLIPFRDEGLNITAIDSMTGIITPSEGEKGVDPDKIVDFDIGIDMTTYTEEGERRVKEELYKMGCTIDYSGHKLNR